MYDAEGFQVANELDRFAIGDRDALDVNADGSLDIYVQHDNPGPDKVANWLPAPPARSGSRCGSTRAAPRCSRAAGTRPVRRVG